MDGCWEEGCDYVKTKGCTGIGNERRKNNIGGRKGKKELSEYRGTKGEKGTIRIEGDERGKRNYQNVGGRKGKKELSEYRGTRGEKGIIRI